MKPPPTKKLKQATVPSQLAPQHNTRIDGTNMSLLLEYVRKDPESYCEEFNERHTHFLELSKLIRLQPAMHRIEVNPMIELTSFLASAAFCYPDKAKQFVTSIVETLHAQGVALEPDLRIAFAKAVVAMRHRGVLELEAALDVFFELVKCDDKQLRKFIQGALVSFIRKHHKRVRRVDSKMQAYIFARLKDVRAVVVRVAQLVLVEAFRRGFWRDGKTATAISETIFNKTPKVRVGGIRFFLGTTRDEEAEESDTDDDEGGDQDNNKSLREVMTAFRHAKKTRKRQKQLASAKKSQSKEKKAKKEKNRQQCNIAAMRLLFDPQTLADRVFGLLDGKRNERYSLKLMLMALIAKLIAVNRLQVLSFYSYLHKYLQPKQREVTRILLYAAQACQGVVTDDIVHDLVYCIAQNFVSDRNSPEAMTVGLNAIREIYVNVPSAAQEELLHDLTEYKRYANKNVSMAARGLIQLFRAIDPLKLRAKDRGRPPKEAAAKDDEESDNEAGAQATGDSALIDGGESVDGEEAESDEGIEDDDDDDIEGIEDDEDADEKEEEAEEAVEVEPPRLTNDEQLLEEEISETLQKREDTDRLATLSDITRMHKKKKQSKAERLEQVKDGRGERDEHKKRKKNGPHVGRTNAALSKRKNFQMVRHKVRGKNRQRSFRDQQISLRNYLIRQTGKKV